MEQKNRAAYMTAVGRMEIRESPMPAVRAGEIILKVEYVGVCGSDVHFFETAIRKGKPFRLPFILGHECAGIVAKIGAGVKSLKVGDRVCFEPQITCGKCVYCRSGHYNMCPDVVFPSTPPYDGMLRDYVAIPAENAFKLPDGISTKEGALIEPLAVGLSAAEKGEVSLGKTVVILGAGCIGLVTMMACKAMGASQVIMTDLYAARLEHALKLGADAVINASEEDTVQKVMELTNGEGADVVFEAASNHITASQTADLVRRCGIVILVGNINGITPYRFMDLMYREAQIRTIYRYRNNFNTALKTVAAGRINVNQIISHEFDFSDVQTAFEKSVHDRQNVIKTVIKMK